MASGWNLWVWLQCIGVASQCCYKEVYRYPHNCERSELYVRVGRRNSLVYIYIYIFVSMGRPFGPAWAPRNAQRANVGPAGLGSMVNVIALKTATLVLSRG